MKNNKTPGLDGFSSEFFKVFWGKLKFFVLRSLNYSFDKGILPLTLRQCVISCLPKGHKPREFLKNWRPISLLSVLYKIASTAIANRLKPTLNNLISRSQTGFIPGRYIGECTRLVYDLLHHTETNEINGMLVLIDFEKAFDSISWNFLYKVMELFGFNENFINWIKLFNNNVTAFVTQCGFLSERLNIERGARQGDPIAAYLFILCAEILSIMVKENKDIKGIHIKQKDYKLVQFADDTTLFLDGTKKSLQTSLNVLEIFGSISGLKINTEKTKIVWIGRKRFSKEKLSISIPLTWGINEFDLLGIRYNLKLSDIISDNYTSAIHNIQKIVLAWSKRTLTPFGKITVIKTFLLSKLNHLFISLPNPAPSLLDKINTIFYKFIWDNKPDKVKRDILTQSYLNGGLKMINIYNHLLALKTTWIRRMILDDKSIWAQLFNDIIISTRNLMTLGTTYYRSISSNQVNVFWKDVFGACYQLSKALELKCKTDLLSQTLWHNPIISDYTIYFPTWYKAGIIFIRDIINATTGDFLTANELSLSFNININFLDYHRIIANIKRFLAKHKDIYCDLKFECSPIIPSHLSVFIRHHKGAKDMYNPLNFKPIKLPCIFKWDNELNINITDLDQKAIFKACFNPTTDHNLIWLQYKIIFRILGTREHTTKIRLTSSNLCRLCSVAPETISHLFYHCTKSANLWQQIKDWISQNINVTLPSTIDFILLGYYIIEPNFTALNLIFLNTKHYIFNCAHFQRPLNFETLKRKRKRSYLEHETIAKINFDTERFSKTWFNWRPLFQDIQ